MALHRDALSLAARALVSLAMERTLRRRSIGAADCHPLSVRRFAPSIKRMQRTVAPANKFAYALAADPQPRYAP